MELGLKRFPLSTFNFAANSALPEDLLDQVLSLAQHYYSTMTFHLIIIFLSFSGALVSLFPCGQAVLKLAISVLALFAVLKNFDGKIPRYALLMITPFIIYLSYAVLVAPHRYPVNGIQMIFLMQPMLFCLVIYVWALYVKIDIRQLQIVKNIVLIIIVIQIIFAFVKFFFHGIDEGWLIGTMSLSAGQLSFHFPAIAIPILIFLKKKKNSLLIYSLIFAMFIFGIINEKRSIIFLLPLVSLISCIILGPLFSEQKSGKGILLTLLIIASLSFAGAAIGISAIPSLNKSEEYGGKVSFKYAFEYALSYLNMDYGDNLQADYETAIENKNVQVGRITLIKSIFRYMFASDVGKSLIGEGFGTATPSSWVSNDADKLFNLIHTRGAISGFGLALVETGLIGATLMIGFFFCVFVVLLIEYEKLCSYSAKRYLRLICLLYIIFCYDYFFYSTLLLRTLPMPIIAFCAFASIFVVKRMDSDLNHFEKSTILKSIKDKNQ